MTAGFAGLRFFDRCYRKFRMRGRRTGGIVAFLMSNGYHVGVLLLSVGIILPITPLVGGRT